MKSRSAAAVLDPPSTKTSRGPTHPLHAVEEARALFDKQGRFSAKLVADLFGVPTSEVARWLGKSRQAVSQTPTAASLQQPLAELARVAAVRHAVADDAAFRAWLRMPQALLENRSPLDWIERGRRRQVGDFVQNILTGNFS